MTKHSPVKSDQCNVNTYQNLITLEPQPYLAVVAAWVESAQQYNQGGESCLQAYIDD